MDFFEGKQGVFYGDSLVQGIGVLPGGQYLATPTDDVVSQLEKLLKCNIVNAAFGGTGMSDGSCSFVKMVDSLISGDYTQQYEFSRKLDESYKDSGFSGLITQMDKMSKLKPEDVDFVCVAFGTNDWTYGVALDNPDDPCDSDTLLGALRKGLIKLMTNLPHAEIYVFTPTFRIWQDNPSDGYVHPKTGLKLLDVANAIEGVCKEFHVPCGNMYEKSMTNKYNWELYTCDGTHRNARGYALLARQYAKVMLSI